MAKNKPNKNEEFKPNGTVAVLVIFLVTLIALWGYVYYLLVSRGATI